MIDVAEDPHDAADDDDESRPWGEPRYEPSLAEIAEATAEIRAGWTQDERESRWAGPRAVRWRVPGSHRGGEVVPRDAQAGFVGRW